MAFERVHLRKQPGPLLPHVCQAAVEVLAELVLHREVPLLGVRFVVSVERPVIRAP